MSLKYLNGLSQGDIPESNTSFGRSRCQQTSVWAKGNGINESKAVSKDGGRKIRACKVYLAQQPQAFVANFLNNLVNKGIDQVFVDHILQSKSISTPLHQRSALQCAQRFKQSSLTDRIGQRITQSI